MSGILERKKAEWQEEAMQAGMIRGIEESNISTARKMLLDGTIPIDKIAGFVA